MIKTLKWIIGDCIGITIIILVCYIFIVVDSEIKTDSILSFLNNLFVGILGGLIVSIITSTSQIVKEREKLEDDFSVLIRKIISKIALMQICPYKKFVNETASLKELILSAKKIEEKMCWNMGRKMKKYDRIISILIDLYNNALLYDKKDISKERIYISKFNLVEFSKMVTNTISDSYEKELIEQILKKE